MYKEEINDILIMLENKYENSKRDVAYAFGEGIILALSLCGEVSESENTLCNNKNNFLYEQYQFENQNV
jgi:hypothetical protein